MATSHVARSDLDRAIELDRPVHYFWVVRAKVRVEQGDQEGALAELDEATRFGPSTERYITYVGRGDIEYSLSMIDRAIADYTEAIRLEPKRAQTQDTRLYGGRGDLYLAHGAIESAMVDLNEAIRLDSKAAWPHFNRGIAFARKGQFDQAISDFDTARRLAVDDKPLAGACLMSRGDVLAMAGRIAEAEAVYAETIKFDPNRLHPILNARAWFIDRPRADYAAALKKLDQTASGGMIIQYLHRGLIYARLGKADRVLADFDEVINRMKNRHGWFAVADYLVRRLAVLIGRAEAYLLKGDLDRALAEVDEAVKFVPSSREARLLRAEIHSRRGKTDLATADRLEASRLAPDPIIARP